MLSKRILLLGIVCLFWNIKSFSQVIIYDYDNNGSRISRTIYIGPPIQSNLIKPETSDRDAIEESQIVPIESIISNCSVSLFPNPVDYYLEIRIENLESKAEIIISDEFGKITDVCNVEKCNNQIDFRNKASGTYFIKITINSKSESWKIIKE